MEIPSHCRYTDTHEWLQLQEDDIVRVGISDHAQQMLGDVVFIELPEIGQELSAGDETCVIESVKAAADVYCPVDGVVVAVNNALHDAPALVNNDPYGDGWLFEIKVDEPSDIEDCLDADSYREQLSET